MTTALSIRAFAAMPFFPASLNPRVVTKRRAAAGLFQVLGNRSEWKSAATVAFTFFVVSLALAPALTPDRTRLAAEINTKTLKAAAAIKAPARTPFRVQD